LDKGVSLEVYLEAREYGLAHTELVSIDPTVWDVEAWIKARISGIAGEDLREAKRAGIATREYTLGRSLDVTHNEMIMARRLHVATSDYLEARRCGVTHREAAEVIAVYGRQLLLDYSRARLCGACHDQVAQVLISKVYIFDYTKAYSELGSHDEALASARSSKAERQLNKRDEYSPGAQSEC
jgi:hypothetical protein